MNEHNAENDAPCSYEDRWTDEVGIIPVCTTHGNNSRHVDSDDPHRPCLSVDPYPPEPCRVCGGTGRDPLDPGDPCPACVFPPGEVRTR